MTSDATSLGVPIRPTGISSEKSPFPAIISVSMNAGATALDVIPNGAYSRAIDLAKASSPPLEAA